VSLSRKAESLVKFDTWETFVMGNFHSMLSVDLRPLTLGNVHSYCSRKFLVQEPDVCHTRRKLQSEEN
jgi:hypothetical protein